MARPGSGRRLVGIAAVAVAMVALPCVPAVAQAFTTGGPGTVNNPAVDTLVQSFSWSNADVAAQGVTSAVGQAIGGALTGPGPAATGFAATGFAPERTDTSVVDDAFAALGYAAKAARREPAALAVPRWNLWSEARITRLDGRSNGTDLEADQRNVTLGLDRRIADSMVIGLVGGFENFDNRLPSLAAKLTGEGWSIGPYLGVRLDPRTILEASAIYSRLNYTARNAVSVGDFDSDRAMAALGLVQSWSLGGLTIEPSLRGYVVRESQAGFVDSIGVSHAGRQTRIAGVTAGSQVSTSLVLSEAVRVVPSLGAYLEYKSVDADPPAIGSVDYSVNDGASAKLTAGLALISGSHFALSLGGSAAALGSGDHVLWTGQGALALKF